METNNIEKLKDSFSKLKKLVFGEEIKLMAEAKLEDGSIIGTQADEFAEGVDVFLVEDGETMPLEPGTYTTEDGFTLTVEEAGTVASYEAVEEEAPEEEMSNTEDLKEQIVGVMGFLENIMTELQSHKEQLAALTPEVVVLSEETKEDEAKEDAQAEAEAIVLSKEKSSANLSKPSNWSAMSQTERSIYIKENYKN